MAQLNGETLVFYIIGDPIAQVKSPALLTARMQIRGINGIVLPGHVMPKDLTAFMAGAAALKNIGGIIATIPHKQAMVGFCATVSDRVRYAGSANVLRPTDAGWWGDNTDGQGYVQGIKASGGTIADKKVLLIGAGGAGSAVAFEFLELGAAELHIHDIDEERRDSLIERLSARFPDKVHAGSPDPTGFDIVGNATPLGMREGDPLPVETEKLRDGQFVADVVTMPEVSPLIAAARAAGCATMPGIEMFRAQADLLIDGMVGTRDVPVL